MRWLDGVEWLDAVQWLALAVTVLAAWMVGSQRKGRREIGFVFFLVSNVLWVIWGLHDDALALIALQGFLAISNVRGIVKNRQTT